MTDENHFGLSRRRLLGGLSTIGAAGALGGASTLAFFSDEEQFANNRIVAGELDMKIAATHRYSDWSPDEAAHAGMADAPDDADLLFPAPASNPDAQDILVDIDEGERQAFRDALEDRTINGGYVEDGQNLCGTANDAPGDVGLVELTDVKPGDFGGVQFQFELCNNPGFVWLGGGLQSADENGVNDPEGDDPQEQAGVVELLDEIQVRVYDHDFNERVPQQSLRSFLDQLETGNGILLDGDIPAAEGGGQGVRCFSGGSVDDIAAETHGVRIVWWLPIDHGNQVQSDSVTFDFQFYTEQCRHNQAGVGAGGQDDCIDQSIDLSTGTGAWTITGGPITGDPEPASDPHPNWVAPPDCAQWIVPPGTSGTETEPDGTYTYEAAFEIDDQTESCTLALGPWAVDNNVEVYLDDDPTPIASYTNDEYGWMFLENESSPVEVTIDTPGTHTLRAEVSNEVQATGNPTGFLACASVTCTCE